MSEIHKYLLFTTSYFILASAQIDIKLRVSLYNISLRHKLLLPEKIDSRTDILV